MENQTKDDKDILIGILMSQRNSLMDQVTQMQLTIEKMLPQIPKDKNDNDKSPNLQQ